MKRTSMYDIFHYVTRNVSGNYRYEIMRHSADDGYTLYCFGKGLPKYYIEFSGYELLDTEKIVERLEKFVEDKEAIFHSPLYKALE